MLSSSTLENQLEMAPGNYRKGGSVSLKKFTPAHMAPYELDILDHLQGGQERHRKTGMRSYRHLENMMHNPHFRKTMMSCAQRRFAEGGAVSSLGHWHDEVTGGDEQHKMQRLLDLLMQKKMMTPDELTKQEMDFLAANGHHGDREIAAIGPHTHHVFDQLAGKKTRNDRTGLPEYWSIGPALSGLWDVLKGAGSGFAGGASERMGEYGSRALAGAHPGLGTLAGHAGAALGQKFRGMGETGTAGNRLGRSMGQKGGQMFADYLSQKFGMGGYPQAQTPMRTQEYGMPQRQSPRPAITGGLAAKFGPQRALPSSSRMALPPSENAGAMVPYHGGMAPHHGGHRALSGFSGGVNEHHRLPIAPEPQGGAMVPYGQQPAYPQGANSIWEVD